MYAIEIVGYKHPLKSLSIGIMGDIAADLTKEAVYDIVLGFAGVSSSPSHMNLRFSKKCVADRVKSEFEKFHNRYVGFCMAQGLPAYADFFKVAKV